MAIVLKFIRCIGSSSPIFIKSQPKQPRPIFIKVQSTQPSSIKHQATVFLSNNEIDDGKAYFFWKASEKIKHFNKPNFYKNFSTEQSGILRYTGRILLTENVTVVGRMTNYEGPVFNIILRLLKNIIQSPTVSSTIYIGIVK